MKIKKKVPKISISGKVVDIKKRSPKAEPSPILSVVRPEARTVDLSLPRKSAWPKVFVWIFLGLAGLVFITFGAGFYYLKYRLPGLIRDDVAELQSAASELKVPGLETGDNIGEFQLDISQFSKIFGLFGDMQNLTQDFSTLVLEVQALEESWPELVLAGKGEELIARLKEIRSRLESISSASERLRGIAGFSPWGEEYILAQTDIVGLLKFLDRLILWLDSPEPRQILVLLQNPSELRPGGGFVGSYAEVELRRGSAEKIEVKDINDSDRNFGLKIVPPRELQLITKRWRAADANWFFDFSDSAEKTLALFEDGEKYDAVFGVSAGAVEDILRITGPLELKDRGLVLNADNFLIELQKQVQIGQAEGADFPKEILGEFMPLITEKIISMDGVAKRELANKLAEWAERKDIQVYFKDKELQKFFEDLGVAGRVFQAPEPWNGDYLAVVFGNVGGGKSDFYIEEKLFLESQINSDGTLSNHLVIFRKHAGEKSKYSWYRVLNRGYIRVLVPQGAKLAYAKGGTAKNVSPRVNYAKEGYAKDPLVSEMENNREASGEFPEVEIFSESGKRVFGTWVMTDPGKTSQLVFDYSRRLLFSPQDGTKYEFVFERQSGVRVKYSIEINAPVGFRFRENNLPVFEYDSFDPPGRLVLNLTLQKI